VPETVRVPFSFLTDQFANPEPVFEKLRAFLRRCDFTLGEDVDEFERRYAAFTGARHAIGVGTGTDALALSLQAVGVKPGDEVITCPNTFIATVGAIVQVGARPVFVDCGDDLLLDVNRIEAAITKKTGAILPVHWAGAPADMKRILEIAAQHRIPVVEDACQALGARSGGRAVGTLGQAGGFSVHPIKPLHVWGDGGVIVTNDDDIARQLRLRRNHGLSSRDEVAVFGVNSRLDSLQAIVGNDVFESLPETLGKRIAFAERYDRAFREERFKESIEVPRRPEGTHVYHLYQIFSRDRDGLLARLKSRGVEAKVHYPIPVHLQPAAKSLGHKPGDFPKAERQSASSLTLPCHQYLTEGQIDYVVSVVAEYCGV
jgi:dTDP-3-amino-2,3,6-trideoxy-4-keto-D-glucose/dTDP-3-amino-3,4,6-trideoxy-alpha-D-glucose/dTDP-2,6-dideoxy-D-kanosamine transaminase